jgi:bifunctional DNA-binding transcriptional regulator/antitoxin component of YhaV-PrlF toxin-antitoxin module
MITAKLSVNDMTRIPKQVRQDLKLNQGDRIVFEKKGDEYFIRKLVEESREHSKNIPVWSAVKPHTEYAVGDLVLGNDGRTYRLKRLGWQFFDPTSPDGKNSWELA